MSIAVTSAASPRTLSRSKRPKKRRPAGTGAPAQAPAAPKPTRSLPATAATTPAAAGAAAAQPAAKPAAAPEPAAPVASPEYSPSAANEVVGDVANGVTQDMLRPYISKGVGSVLSPERIPALGNPYGAVIPGRIAGTITGEAGKFVGSAISNALAGVLGGERKPGIGYEPTPANKLIAGTTKGVVTTWMKMALTEALKPAPQPKPIYAPDVKPIGVEQPPAPPTPRKVLLTDTSQIRGAVTNGLIGVGISTLYDQTVGPLVQRAANFVTGRGNEEVKAPSPLTPGRVVNGLVDSILSSMLVRSVTYSPLPGPPGSPPPAPGATPVAGALGASIVNGILGAAWSTVYGRGLGSAIENGVNDLAGIRSKEEQDKATLPALEHFTRAATRGVAVGATTYVLGNALNSTMVNIGASIGGVGGALVAMAGAALIGSIGGTVVDAAIGPMLGKLGGQVYSWITGKPSYEQRMEEAAKKPAEPGPTPGDPVKAPNGNPGTVPAPSAPAAPPAAAPAAGAPKKRRRTGQAAVDRTAPAIDVPAGKLAAIAARS
jgi:hypothetical protein